MTAEQKLLCMVHTFLINSQICGIKRTSTHIRRHVIT